MGIITSKDTRRISFNNTFALTPAINIQKSIEDDDDIAIGGLETERPYELNKDTNRCIELHDDEHDYWAQRIDYLKNEHQIINKIIENEYEKTIEETNKLFETPRINQEKIQKINPCFDWRSKLLKCYEDNPRQPLMCSAIVQAFTNCVSSCQLEE